MIEVNVELVEETAPAQYCRHTQLFHKSGKYVNRPIGLDKPVQSILHIQEIKNILDGVAYRHKIRARE